MVIAAWLVATGLIFGFAFPRLTNSLVDLRQSHEKQVTELHSLQAQALALEKMQSDLQQAENQEIKLSSFFTSDVTLVHEVQRIEEIANKTNMTETLTLTGSSDKAQVVQSQSGLLSVPYTLNLHGSFLNYLNFLKYFENSYFISPVNAMTINFDVPGSVNVTLQSNFLLRK
jgi:hypothetical protein